MRRVGNKVLAEAFESLREQSAAFAIAQDPEVVHQLRVAARQLRVAMRFFKGTLDRDLEESLRVDLKWLFGKLGALRDLQVFHVSLVERVTPETPGAAALVRSVQRKIDRLHRTVVVLLAGKRYHRLVDDVASLVARSERDGPTKKRFLRRLRKQRQRTLAALAATLEDETRIHAARKELKKLRYGCELGAPLLPKARLRRYQKRMKAVQDRLGAVVDLSVWLTLVRVHCRNKTLRDHLTADLKREQTRGTAGLALPIKRLAQASPPWR